MWPTVACAHQVNRSVFERMAKRLGCTVEVLTDGDEVEAALARSGQLKVMVPASPAAVTHGSDLVVRGESRDPGSAATSATHLPGQVSNYLSFTHNGFPQASTAG
jgi:CheY-like chemotaxis protein